MMFFLPPWNKLSTGAQKENADFDYKFVFRRVYDTHV